MNKLKEIIINKFSDRCCSEVRGFNYKQTELYHMHPSLARDLYAYYFESWETHKSDNLAARINAWVLDE